MELQEGNMNGTSGPENISTRLLQIAELARAAPKMVMTTLAHHIDLELMHEAYRRTRKDGATGVDGQTAGEYAEKLGANLERLLEEFKSGSYRAPPVRRAYVPKAGGKLRPIGIPTFEDKILQRAALMILEAIYEQDFYPCSHGFRPGRSAHGALASFRDRLMRMNGGWIIEADIESFFDTLDHRHLRSFLDQRVRDGVLRRQIDKWLRAGVLEGGAIHRAESGSPQGGTISPLLANIYLHEVLDRWWEEQVKPRLRGDAELVRYADDFVLVFANEEDACRVFEVLPKRFARFGLALHPEKTRLLDFRRPRQRHDPKVDKRPDTFDLLGFTHYWGRAWRGRGEQGWWVVKNSTARARFSRALRAINEWCSKVRHLPIVEQWKRLCLKMRGHYGYYAVSGNARAVTKFHAETRRIWRKWLQRRSRAGMTWERFARLMIRYPLPRPRIVINFHRSAAKP
jgi:group II intron reverse transcriptase/maturase